ncbi:acyltransferase family protein [Chitinophaga vietnamensis]|uniref:acyltransferase family protein n=1 Tax=Chitinophaga vietnamensis TaxID=2593957 RepID=UPI001177552E|nr:acyltransferase [Chitinophaga vietnamensis]
MTNNPYIRSLDGVRAIAISGVMLFHWDILRFGWVGVPLFFVLSGYLISGILLREKQRPDSLAAKLKKFWIRRALRIFPLYYGYLLLFVVIFLVWGYPADYKQELPWLLTYTYNYTAFHGVPFSPVYSHFWSLCVEEQFYLFFPPAVLLLRVSQLRKLTIAMLVAGPLYRLLFSLYLRHMGQSDTVVYDAVFWSTPSNLDAFFTGAAIHLFELPARVKRPHWLFAGVLAATLLAGGINYLSIKDSFSASVPYISQLGFIMRHSGHWQEVWYNCFFFPLAGALLLLMVSPYRNPLRNALQHLFESRPLVAVGKVSYGMYLYHWIIMELMWQPFLNRQQGPFKYLYFIVFFLVVYAVSYISYRWFEQWFIQLKDKLTAAPALITRQQA